jgi:hypothetical protein
MVRDGLRKYASRDEHHACPHEKRELRLSIGPHGPIVKRQHPF